MTEANSTAATEATEYPPYSRADYCAALRRFDGAICEATAVSQAQAGRMAKPYIGYATNIFSRICSHGTSMIRAAPLSRWVRSDFEDWCFSAVAGHARAILEGHLLYCYLIEEPKNEAEAKARVLVMHINDCTRRIKLHSDLGDPGAQILSFKAQLDELQDGLTGNEYFLSLPQVTQRACLSGKYLMIESRDDMLARLGHDKGYFDALYDLWSQHTHVLPLSFYRMEPNGRGTGLENDTDRAYIGQALLTSAELLDDATNLLVSRFPDIASVRHGVKSQFSPGPRENRPKSQAVSGKVVQPSHQTANTIATAINKMFGPD